MKINAPVVATTVVMLVIASAGNGIRTAIAEYTFYREAIRLMRT